MVYPFWSTAWTDGVAVAKADIRNGLRDYVPTIITLSGLQGMTTQQAAYVLVLLGTNYAPTMFKYDASDTTTADDSGVTCIVSADGYRYKPQRSHARFGGTITSAGNGYGGATWDSVAYSYTGGTPGVVNSASHTVVTVASGVADYVWAGLDLLTNSATAGENVARYSKAIKGSTGATWATVSEADDTTETANPSEGLYAHEIDLSANGTDNNNTRRGCEVVGWRSNSSGADVTFAYAFRAGSSAADDGHVFFKKGLSFQGGAGTFQIGIDLSETTYSTAAIKLGSDTSIIPDTSGNVLFAHGSAEDVLLVSENTALGNAYKSVFRLRHTAAGTFAAGVGTGIEFETQTGTSTKKVGGYIGSVFSSVSGGAEEATFEFGLMSSGAAAAGKLRLSATELKPTVNDLLSLGTSALSWSDLYLASGAVVNFSNGDVTLAHSSHHVTLANATFTVTPNANATQSDSATYQIQMQDSGGQTRISFGYDGSYGVIQSWGGSSLVLNPQGNNVGVGISPTTTLHSAGPIRCGSYTVATLPSAASVGAGARAFVTDANATTFHATVAAGGANAISVISDGTNWKIGG